MNEVIIITGQRGKGKTTYLKSIIEKYDRVIIFDLLGEFCQYETAYNLKEYFQKLTRLRKESFFYLNYFNPKNSEEDFDIVCKSINRLQDIVFIIDELDYFTNANYTPKDFAEIIKRGRHQNLNVIASTRRPHEIPRLVTSQLSQFITFRQLEPRDLSYTKDVVGLNPEEIQALQDFEYIVWKNGLVFRGKTKPIKKKDKSDIYQEHFINLISPDGFEI